MSQRVPAGSTLVLNSRPSSNFTSNNENSAMFYNDMNYRRAVPSVSMFQSVWRNPTTVEKSNDSVMWNIGIWSFDESSDSLKKSANLCEPAPFSHHRDIMAGEGFCDEILRTLNIDGDEANKKSDLDFANNGRDFDLNEKDLVLTTAPIAFSTPIAAVVAPRRIIGRGNILQAPKKENNRQLDYTTYSNGNGNGGRRNKAAAATTKRYRDKYAKTKFCVFCKTSGRPESEYTQHVLKDEKGLVTCPQLRDYKCSICHQDGDFAHTVRYCPNRPIVSESNAVAQ